MVILRCLRSIAAATVLSSMLYLGGCGPYPDEEKKDPINPAGAYSLSFSNRIVGNALGACAVSPTNPDTVSIQTLQNSFTWTESTLTVNVGTMSCTAENCAASVILDGLFGAYSYTYNVTITPAGMTGTLLQHGLACDDTYTVIGTRL